MELRTAKIVTPYPSISAIADEVGVEQRRVTQLRRLIRSIVEGKPIRRRLARHPASRRR